MNYFHQFTLSVSAQTLNHMELWLCVDVYNMVPQLNPIWNLST